MKKYLFKLSPVSKPRMTRRDTWARRDCVLRYWAFKDLLTVLAKNVAFSVPDSGMHLKFHLPMPKSWSAKKRTEYLNRPHRSKPDVDNLLKAFLDCLCPDGDAMVWDVRASKFWSEEGHIEAVTSIGEPL